MSIYNMIKRNNMAVNVWLHSWVHLGTTDSRHGVTTTHIHRSRYSSDKKQLHRRTNDITSNGISVFQRFDSEKLLMQASHFENIYLINHYATIDETVLTRM